MKLAASKVFFFEGDDVGTIVVVVEILEVVDAGTKVVFSVGACVLVDALAVVGDVGTTVVFVVGTAVLTVVGVAVGPSQGFIVQLTNKVSFLHSAVPLLQVAQAQPVTNAHSVQFFKSQGSAATAAVIPSAIRSSTHLCPIPVIVVPCHTACPNSATLPAAAASFSRDPTTNNWAWSVKERPQRQDCASGFAR